jgi:hypothetical protein
VKAHGGEFLPREAAYTAGGERRRADDLEEPRRRRVPFGPKTASATASVKATAASAGSPPRRRSALNAATAAVESARPRRCFSPRASRTAARSHDSHAIVVVAFRNAADETT